MVIDDGCERLWLGGESFFNATTTGGRRNVLEWFGNLSIKPEWPEMEVYFSPRLPDQIGT